MAIKRMLSWFILNCNNDERNLTVKNRCAIYCVLLVLSSLSRASCFYFSGQCNRLGPVASCLGQTRFRHPEPLSGIRHFIKVASWTSAAIIRNNAQETIYRIPLTTNKENNAGIWWNVITIRWVTNFLNLTSTDHFFWDGTWFEMFMF